MLKKYLHILMLLLSAGGIAQNISDTRGELQISEMGSSNYTVPIVLPPSAGNVAPVLNLSYSSGVMGGVVGQGWNISNVSTISRISSRIDIDGFQDGVDFDNNDKWALDGHRLIPYQWEGFLRDAIGFRTEIESNTKIYGRTIGSGVIGSFTVIDPDGSISIYENVSSITSPSFQITRHTDIHGNYMTYHYTTLFGNTCLTEIKFSGNNSGALLNSIKFSYKGMKRLEFTYVYGAKFPKESILSGVEVYSAGALFKKYVITHVEDPVLGYERVSQIQEFNGNLEAGNPIVFTYNTTPNSVDVVYGTYQNYLDFGDLDLSGDFDGDGRLDFTSGDQMFTNLFVSNQNATVSNFNFPNIPQNTRKQLFTATTITKSFLGSKINQFQSVVLAHEQADKTDFKVYNLSGNTIVNSYTKTIAINNTTSCVDNCGEGKCDYYDLKASKMVEEIGRAHV